MSATVSKSKLKAQMLSIFRDIEQSGEELIVTDRGRPVLKVIPLHTGKTAKAAFDEFRGKVGYPQDINTPTEEEWSET